MSSPTSPPSPGNGKQESLPGSPIEDASIGKTQQDESKNKDAPKNDDGLKLLQKRSVDLQTKIDKDANAMRYLNVIGVGLILLALIAYSKLSNFSTADIAAITGLSLAVIMIVGRLTLGSRVRINVGLLQDLNLEMDLARYNANVTERRAEKLLQLNQNQLQRYYDLNIRQNMWIFVVGIVALIIGTAIMCGTAWLVLKESSDDNEKIIVAVLGGVGGLLTNFVAFVYLKMHSAQMESLVSFHQRLIRTHELMLANLLAAGIGNSEPRWATLHEMACNITRQSDSRPIDGDKKLPSQTKPES